MTPEQELQILLGEQSLLQSMRSMLWADASSRAYLYVGALSGGVVALALVGQVSQFGEAFLAFAVVVLPAVLFIGWATAERIGAINRAEAFYVRRLNRIHHRYLELEPAIERFLGASPYDDVRGFQFTTGRVPGKIGLQEIAQSTAGVLFLMNATVGGALAAIVLRGLGVATLLNAVAAVLVGLALVLLQAMQSRRQIRHAIRYLPPRYPSPADGDEYDVETARAGPG